MGVFDKLATGSSTRPHMTRFQGSMVAMATPMSVSGEVDYASLAVLVDFHLEQGSDALVPVGTTGESATLSVDEHHEVIRRVVEQVDGRIPVIAGTGANATDEAIELTRNAHEAGADACLLVTPYYNKPTQEGLYQHYRAIAEAVPIPQILYNVPGRTACDMLPETVARLAGVEAIIGIKEATGDLERIQSLRELCGEAFTIISGDDETSMDTLLNGGRGVITVTGNVAPRLMHEMCQAALAGDAETARSCNQKLERLHRDLFIESNPIPVKWCLHRMGLIPEGIRLPLTPLSETYHENLNAAMRAAEVLA